MAASATPWPAQKTVAASIEAEDGRGVFGGLQAGVGAELVGGGPELFFKRGGGGVFLRGGDPLHAAAKFP
jgi:hypothetical protein